MGKGTFYSHIIWDWNGTLLDDVHWNVAVANAMLSRRGMDKIGNVAEYRRFFCVPVINFYRGIGFDFEKESFDDIAHEYIPLYHAEEMKQNCKLHDNARYVLETFKEKGKSQVILSASEKNNLRSQIDLFDISHYFDDILGISDIYAESKINIGKNYISRSKIEKAVLVGDTEHDFEVAKTLGIDCLLVAGGHQGVDKLQLCKVPVLENILDVMEYIS